MGWIAVEGYVAIHLSSVIDEKNQGTGQRFLHLKQVVWSPPTSETPTAPRRRPSILNSLGRTNAVTHDSLKGHHEFPFELEFPAQVFIKDGTLDKDDRTYDLPPTFFEKGSLDYIVYEIHLQIKGAGMFAQDCRFVLFRVLCPVESSCS